MLPHKLPTISSTPYCCNSNLLQVHTIWRRCIPNTMQILWPEVYQSAARKIKIMLKISHNINFFKAMYSKTTDERKLWWENPHPFFSLLLLKPHLSYFYVNTPPTKDHWFFKTTCWIFHVVLREDFTVYKATQEGTNFIIKNFLTEKQNFPKILSYLKLLCFTEEKEIFKLKLHLQDTLM